MILPITRRCPPALAGILISLALNACGSSTSVVHTPSPTFQGLQENTGVVPYADWCVLPCTPQATGSGSTQVGNDESRGKFSLTREIGFDCGSEEELSSFIAGLPAALEAHFAPAGVSWGTVSWAEEVFTITYVDGPMRGTITGEMTEEPTLTNVLVLKVRELAEG